MARVARVLVPPLASTIQSVGCDRPELGRAVSQQVCRDCGNRGHTSCVVKGKTKETLFQTHPKSLFQWWRIRGAGPQKSNTLVS